jgi:virginiamycin B lyase
LGGLAFQPHAAMGQQHTAPAVQGVVTSAEEGAMEGVLVSLKQDGSPLRITVVSDAQGHYAFPRAKLEPGTYAVSIRAIGYDLAGPETISVAPGATASANVTLRKTADLAAQLSNGEWIQSVPGTEAQKAMLLDCMGCHTLQRIVNSKHTVAEFVQLLPRMASYAQTSNAWHPQKRVENVRPASPEALQRRAEFLASINLSKADRWTYPLVTQPRPKGAGTRVIMTEYEMPRQTICPHDVITDPEGQVWFTNFSELFIGKMDPATGKVTEYPMPELKPGFPVGLLDLEMDSQQNLWAGMMFQGAAVKLERKTGKLQVFSLPSNLNTDIAQINMISPTHYTVDGKLWMESNGIAGIHRVDLKTGTYETFLPYKGIPGDTGSHNLYTVVADSKNNAYFTDLNQDYIGRVDAATGKWTLWHTPTPHSNTRRGRVDAEDRFWFAEHRGNNVAMFDPRTEKITEWPVPTPWSAPYDVALDKTGTLWTGGMANDRIVRLDPKTGAATEYLLPRETNIRRVFVDNSTTPVTFWVGNAHGASIVKVEPIE